MAATLSYGASQAGPVAQHATKYLGSLTYDQVDIIRVQGKPPKPQKPVAKPKPIAKPKAVAPRAAAKPIASASGRTRSASSLPSRAKNLKWTAPSRATLQRPSVSAGARKLNSSSTNARLAASKPFSPVKQTQAIKKLRNSTATINQTGGLKKNSALPKSLKGHQILSTGDTARQKLGPISRAFNGPVVELKLSRPLVVHRRSGGDSAAKGQWFSLRNYSSPGKARRFLALPSGNSAVRNNSFIIPKGTTIFVGKASSQVGQAWAGSYATGGGQQIYAPRIGNIKMF